METIPKANKISSSPLTSPFLYSLLPASFTALQENGLHSLLQNMSRPGDWNCRSCQHLNFQRRDNCQRCGESRYGIRVGSTLGFTAGSDVRPGDWYCTAGNCGTHNFASRSTCFNCGAFKDESGGGFDFDMSRSRGFGGNRSGWKSGDWICTRLGCNEHNFASRMECFRCSAPREFNNRTSY